MKKNKSESSKTKINEAPVETEKDEDVEEKVKSGFPEDVDFKRFLGCGG